jgi:hypothetical protein
LQDSAKILEFLHRRKVVGLILCGGAITPGFRKAVSIVSLKNWRGRLLSESSHRVFAFNSGNRRVKSIFFRGDSLFVVKNESPLL